MIKQKTLPQWVQKSNNIPWFWDKRLTNTNVRLNSWWWNFKIWYFTFNSTWNISITWVWFKPKWVIFNYTNQAWVIGNWAMDWTSQYWYEDNLWTQIQTECIYIRNSWWAAIWRAVYVSMDNDWFTINATLASTTIYVNYIAFW